MTAHLTILLVISITKTGETGVMAQWVAFRSIQIQEQLFKNGIIYSCR